MERGRGRLLGEGKRGSGKRIFPQAHAHPLGPVPSPGRPLVLQRRGGCEHWLLKAELHSAGADGLVTPLMRSLVSR